MTDEDTVTVDNEFLNRSSHYGGFRKEQLQILGLPVHPPKGWKATVVGMKLTRAQAERFVALGPVPIPVQALPFQR